MDNQFVAFFFCLFFKYIQEHQFTLVDFQAAAMKKTLNKYNTYEDLACACACVFKHLVYGEETNSSQT